MKKINKTDWFTEGFDILEAEGFTKVTIDGLCERLQITKGSFYHHFKNMDGYVAALMDYWVETNTLSIIRKAETAKDAISKKKLLDQLAMDRSLKLEQTIRAWGYSDDAVRVRVQETDKIRMDYLTGLEIESGRDPARAKDIAVLTYAVFIGVQQLFPDLTKKERDRLTGFFSASF